MSAGNRFFAMVQVYLTPSRKSTLRVTPAMEAGIATRIWDIRDLVAVA
jgi:hypothetical protein